MAEVWNPLFAALISSFAVGVQLSGSLTCNFINVESRDGEILAITPDSQQSAQQSTSIGLNCQGDFYDLENDRMWRIGNWFSLFAMAMGVTAVLIAWSGVILTPTLVLWKITAVIASLSAMLQVPTFVIFESYPCTDFQTQQECKLASGGYLLIVSVVSWIGVTAITQFLDPPLWRQRLHLWRIKKGRTVDTTLDDDEDGGHDIENGSQDPIFESGFQQSDSLVDYPGRKHVLGLVKRLIEQRCSVDDDTPSEDTSRRIVRNYSFSVPPTMVTVANQMGKQPAEDQKSGSAGEERCENGAGLPWALYPKSQHRNITNKKSEQQKIPDVLKVDKCNSKEKVSIISSAESMLDTITGEESMLDASSEDTATNNHPTDKALGNFEDEDEDSLEGDENRPILAGPLSSYAPKGKNIKTGSLSEAIKSRRNPNEPEVVSSRRPPIGMHGYQRMIDHDEIDSPTREEIPMMEVTIDRYAPKDFLNLEELRSMSNRSESFDDDDVAPQRKTTGESRKKKRHENDSFDIDNLEPPDTSDEDSRSESETESNDGSESNEDDRASTSRGRHKSQTTESDIAEQESPRKVLRPSHVRRKRRNSGSVCSSHSLLSYIIQEETEEDLKKDQDSNNSSSSLQHKRAQSSPNLASTPSILHLHETPLPISISIDNAHSPAADDISAMLSVYTSTSVNESVLTGPLPETPLSPQAPLKKTNPLTDFAAREDTTRDSQGITETKGMNATQSSPTAEVDSTTDVSTKQGAIISESLIKSEVCSEERRRRQHEEKDQYRSQQHDDDEPGQVGIPRRPMSSSSKTSPVSSPERVSSIRKKELELRSEIRQSKRLPFDEPGRINKPHHAIRDSPKTAALASSEQTSNIWKKELDSRTSIHHSKQLFDDRSGLYGKSRPPMRTSPRSSPRTSPKSSPRTSPKSSPRNSPKSSPRTSPKSSPRTSPEPVYSIWKKELELRTNIHHTVSYVSSSDSSSQGSNASGRGKVRQARMQRLHNEKHLRQNNSSATTMRESLLQRRDTSGMQNSLTPKRGSRRSRTVSPDHRTEDMSSSAHSEMQIEDSFLLDSVDLSLAQLARESDEEYGAEEDSI